MKFTRPCREKCFYYPIPVFGDESNSVITHTSGEVHLDSIGYNEGDNTVGYIVFRRKVLITSALYEFIFNIHTYILYTYINEGIGTYIITYIHACLSRSC